MPKKQLAAEPGAPFLTAIFAIQSRHPGARRPRTLLHHLAREMYDQLAVIAGTELPPFALRAPTNPNVRIFSEAKALTARLTSGAARPQDWTQSLEWLERAHQVITGTGRGRRHNDAVALRVHEEVRKVVDGWDLEWLAVALGYGSVAEANRELGDR